MLATSGWLGSGMEQSLAQDTYTVAKTAGVLKVSERKVRYLVNEGKVLAGSSGGERDTMIPKQALLDYMVPPPWKFF